MAKKKKKLSATDPSELLHKTVKAGRTAIKEAQKRVPPDWRDQVEKIVARATKEMQAQLAVRLDQLGDSIDALSKKLAENGAATKPASRRRAALPAGKSSPAARNRAKAATRSSGSAKASGDEKPRRAAAPRRRSRPGPPPTPPGPPSPTAPESE